MILASGGDDGPKTKRDSSHPNYSNHPPTPQAAPSPGAGSLNSMHDEFGDGNSPGGGWPRTPASPVRHFFTVKKRITFTAILYSKKIKLTHFLLAVLFIV